MINKRTSWISSVGPSPLTSFCETLGPVYCKFPPDIDSISFDGHQTICCVLALNIMADLKSGRLRRKLQWSTHTREVLSLLYPTPSSIRKEKKNNKFNAIGTQRIYQNTTRLLGWPPWGYIHIYYWGRFKLVTNYPRLVSWSLNLTTD